jgi:hypothetical protein
MRILSLDPGGSTGYAMYHSETREIVQGPLGPDPHHLSLWSLLGGTFWDLIICEQFVYQRREVEKGVSVVLTSVEYIGIVKLHIEICPPELTPQLIMSPLANKAFWDSKRDGGAKLKAAGVYSTDSQHARDATAHLLHYISISGPPEHRDDYFIKKLRPSS